SAAASTSQAIQPQSASGGEPDRWWALLRLSAPVICRAIVFYGLNTFIPLYWIQRYGASKAAGATALTLMLSAGVAGTLLGGWLADRFGRRVVVLVSMLALVPLLWEFVATPSRTLALSLLITIGLAVTLGGLAAPILGRIADLHGVRAAISVLIVIPLAGAAVAFTLPRERSRADRDLALQ